LPHDKLQVVYRIMLPRPGGERYLPRGLCTPWDHSISGLSRRRRYSRTLRVPGQI
jgi:hypothetical protein